MFVKNEHQIPEGYRQVVGQEAFEIKRKSDGSSFIWIPVKRLAANGTNDGVKFSKKFGRRNYFGELFSEKMFNEPAEEKLIHQIQSVNKHGGFYVSKYLISVSTEGKLQSVEGGIPLVKVDAHEAMKLASKFDESLQSHLLYGSEYDCMMEAFYKDSFFSEWTQERYEEKYFVIRKNKRRFCYAPEYTSVNVGFRVAIYMA